MSDLSDAAEAAMHEIERRGAEIIRLMGEVNFLLAALAERDARIAGLVEALRPFAAADRAIGDTPGPFRFETGTGHRLIEREDLWRARRALSTTPEGDSTDE